MIKQIPFVLLSVKLKGDMNLETKYLIDQGTGMALASLSINPMMNVINEDALNNIHDIITEKIRPHVAYFYLNMPTNLFAQWLDAAGEDMEAVYDSPAYLERLDQEFNVDIIRAAKNQDAVSYASMFARFSISEVALDSFQQTLSVSGSYNPVNSPTASTGFRLSINIDSELPGRKAAATPFFECLKGALSELQDYIFEVIQNAVIQQRQQIELYKSGMYSPENYMSASVKMGGNSSSDGVLPFDLTGDESEGNDATDALPM